MAQFMKESGKTIISMALAHTNGPTTGSSPAHGLITTWKAEAGMNGMMVESMKESSIMIKGMVMANSHGRMVESTKVCGKMANNMEKENISILMIMLE